MKQGNILLCNITMLVILRYEEDMPKKMKRQQYKIDLAMMKNFPLDLH